MTSYPPTFNVKKFELGKELKFTISITISIYAAGITLASRPHNGTLNLSPYWNYDSIRALGSALVSDISITSAYRPVFAIFLMVITSPKDTYLSKIKCSR